MTFRAFANQLTAWSLLLALGAFSASNSWAQQQRLSSVSASAGEANAVFVKIPSKPCVYLYENLSEKFTGLDLNFGPIKMDQRTFFLKYCEEKKDELVAKIKEPFEAAQGQIEGVANKASSELVGGFWKFMSERLYAALPAEEQAKYRPGSPEVQALAHRWLNEAPQEEFGTYAAAYLTAGDQESRLLNAWKVYVDLTNGESKSILEGLYKSVTDAQKQLQQILAAKQRIAAEPETPIADILTDVGLSGEWLDYFKQREGQIRALNGSYRITEAMQVVLSATRSEDPTDKVRAFFKLISISGDIASDSNLPLISFVGKIIKSYAEAANATLDEVLALEDLIQKRHGYCLGVGVAARGSRQVYFVDRNVLACPLAYGTWPFKHVYQSQNVEADRFFFFDGEGFVEAENPSGRAGVLAAAQLIQDAIDIGYEITPDPNEHIARIAAVYNTSDPNGVLGLMADAREKVSKISGTVEALTRLSLPGDGCSAEQILLDVSQSAGFSTDSFLRDLKSGGNERLASAIAASFVAFEGRFGPEASRPGANAYETYTDLAEKLSATTVLVLEGRVLDSDRNRLPGASIEFSVDNGRQVRGCEISQADQSGRFTMFALSEGLAASLSAEATVVNGKGRRDTFDMDYFRTNGAPFVERDAGVMARADADLVVEIKGAGEEAEAGDEPETDSGSKPSVEVSQPEEPPTACVNLEGAIGEAKRGLSAGSFELLPKLTNALNAALSEADGEVGCAPETISNAVDLGETLLLIQIEISATEALLDQCEVGAIRAKQISLRQFPDVNFETLQSRLGYALEGIRAFESALSIYKDNILGPAEDILENLPALFSGDCSNYLPRIERGLSLIAALRQFDAQLTATIEACDIPRLEQMNAEIAGREHKYFGEARGRIRAAKATCEARKRDDVASKACGAALTELNDARESYKANNLDLASVQLAGAQARLDNESNQFCPEIAPRIARGNANISALRQEEASLQSALSNCDFDGLNTLRARAISQNHLWFKQAVGRIDEGLAQCETEVVNFCSVVPETFSTVDELLIVGDFETALFLLRETQDMTRDPEARIGCEDLVAKIAPSIQVIERLRSLVSRSDRAISDCSIPDIESVLGEIDGAGVNNAKLDDAKARLVAAIETCQQAVADPAPTIVAEPSPTADEGAGALEIMRDFEATLTQLLRENPDEDTRYNRSVPRGDRSRASTRYDLTSIGRTNDVASSKHELRIDISIQQFASTDAAIPIRQGDEEQGDEFGFLAVASNTSINHSRIRLSKGRYRIEITAETIGFAALTPAGEGDDKFPAAGFAAVIIGSLYNEYLNVDL